MSFVETFADAAEKGSIAYRLCFVYLYIVSGSGAVYLVEYVGLTFPYHRYALGVVFLLGFLLAGIAIAYVINAEYAHWEDVADDGDR